MFRITPSRWEFPPEFSRRRDDEASRDIRAGLSYSIDVVAPDTDPTYGSRGGDLVGDERFGLITPEVAAMAPYEPRTSHLTLARTLGMAPQDLKLFVCNENALGPSALAIEAAQRAVVDANRYPDGEAYLLKAALAERHGVKPEQISVGNGTTEVIELLVRTCLATGQTMVTGWPSYAIYRLAVQAAGREALVAPLRDDRYDLAALAALVDSRTQLVFIANPNNPTGTYVPRRLLAAFMDRIPRSVLVILDEAYAEFADAEDYPDGVADLGHHTNLVVLRTFSKAFGLAGLRIGYGVMAPNLARYLDRVRQPFNVNAVAQAAAVAALSDEAHLRASQRLVWAGKAQLTEGLKRLGLQVIPSQTNFLAVRLGFAASKLVAALKKDGILVRDLTGYGMSEAVRITVGTKADNIVLLERVAHHLSGVGFA